MAAFEGKDGAVATVAIVGTGPRGIAVLERLAHHLSRGVRARRPRVVLLDGTQLGAGRVWRTDQPPWLLMNTVVGELTMAPEGDSVCPLPSFSAWLRGRSGPEYTELGPDDYAPRRIYGEYLRHVYAQVVDALREHADVTEAVGRVTALTRTGDRYELQVGADDATWQVEADAVVLATGHSPAVPRDRVGELARVAEAYPWLLHFAGDAVAEFELDAIPAQADVGVLGLGLSFYDLLLSLSVGRGGEFRRRNGVLEYEPSGKEPVLYAGSRSGVPIGTRGHNQKTAGGSFRPRLFTQRTLARLRERAIHERGSARLDFAAEVLPLLRAEIDLVRYETLVRERDGEEAARRLAAALVAAGPDRSTWPTVLAAHGAADAAPLDLQRLARPFAGRQFASPEQYTRAVHAFLAEDLAEARLGNARGPLKAGLDVIRDARDLLRAAVEYDGLTPGSPGEDFFRDIAPMLSLISTGPPPLRTEQFLALSRAGLVRVVGPGVRFGFDAERELFTVESDAVTGSLRHVQAVVDTRIPAPRHGQGGDPLLGRLVADGVAATWSAGRSDGARYGDPGNAAAGLWVGAATGRLLDPSGRPAEGLYATGIPTEGLRWFTQIGNGRPGSRTAFHREADALALDVVRRHIQD
ncbi:FAD/NAD(P)-binding protein [Streptomyces coerulescens]|uniref:FAD/NAD(P)-binding protein n=1 Tax=Streptomyces coerulescens TaxID=29304 RepID=A0ABW0CKS9_STRCD